MFNVFKKKNDCHLYAVTDGDLIPIENVNDETFSKKLIGDGIAISNISNEIFSPCDGTITMLFPTLHAIGIRMNNGVEVMIHIGVDTVEMKGLGFESFISVGEKVHKGQKLLCIDVSLLNNHNIDLTTMVIVTKSNGYHFSFEKNGHINSKSSIISTFEREVKQ